MKLTSIREVVEDLFATDENKIKGKGTEWWADTFKCHPEKFAAEITLTQTALMANFFGYDHDDVVISIIQKIKN